MPGGETGLIEALRQAARSASAIRHRLAVAAIAAGALTLLGVPAGRCTPRFDRGDGPGPDSLLVVLPADGRDPQPVPIVTLGDTVSCVPLASLARALALDYAWDPYTYRGWIANDTLRTRFTFDSPLLVHGGEMLQMQHAVAYERRGVLLPLDILGFLERELSGGRPARWDRRNGEFFWGNAGASIRQVRVEEVARRGTVTIPAPAPQRSLMVWSPIRGLDVLVDGVAALPESLSVSEGRGTLRVLSCSGWGTGGSRIRLSLGDEVLGASLRYDERASAFEIATTTSRDELDRGGFRPVRPVVPRTSPPGSGVVAVGLKGDPARDPMEARAALQDIADRLVHILGDTLGVPAVLLTESRSPEIAAEANAHAASCTILLGLDRYATGSSDVQIWTAAPRLRWETLTERRADDALTPRPLLWSETPALTAASSERTASRVASHLETLLGSTSVVRGVRPSRWLEGMTMPAVIVYPASSNDRFSVDRLLDWAWRIDFARSLAFAVSEAFLETRQLELVP